MSRVSKLQLEKKYNCHIFRDFGFDDSRLYWVAIGNAGSNITYTDGWTLEELKDNLEKEIGK